MSRMLQVIPMYLQWVPLTSGGSMQHGRDMERIISPTKPRPARSRRSLDKIVDDIVLELGEVEDTEGKLVKLVLSKDETHAKVLGAIKDSAEFFDRWDSWFSREGRAAIAKDAGELAHLIAKVESKLKRLPDLLSDYLFGPREARHVMWINSIPADDIVATTLAEKEALLERLKQLRLDCERQQPPPPSTGPEQDRVQNHCAALARNLMKVLTTRTISGTAEAPCHVIASLVYEAVTGKPKKKLKRAVERALVSDVT